MVRGALILSPVSLLRPGEGSPGEAVEECWL